MQELKMEGKHEAHWVTISSDEYEAMKATIEAVTDEELMKQLKKSADDIRAGRTRKWDAFLKELKAKK